MRNYAGSLLYCSRHLSRPIGAQNHIFSPTTSHSPPSTPSLYIPTPCTLYSTHQQDTRQQNHTPRGGSPSQLPDNEGLLKRGWRKLATLVSAFMTGTKGLYKDVKAMNELKRRHRLVITGSSPKSTGQSTTDLGFTRTQLQFIYQTQKDLKKMIPTVVLFFVPFFGYFVPLVVFMYPHHMLSSHFLTSQQKTDLQRAAASLRAAHISSLLSCDSVSHELRQLETSLNNLGWLEGGRDEEDVESESQDGVAGDNLNRVKGQALESLCGMWGVGGGILSRLLPWTRDSALRSRLESHLRYIFTSDWLVKIEGGPTNLERNDLEQLCVERCLVSGEEGEREEYVDKWVHVSTLFPECPPYLLAHLPLLLQQSKNREQIKTL